MGESCYHVTMLITKLQEDAIRLTFKEKNWPCLLQVLSRETVTDIINSGFTDVFPVRKGERNENGEGHIKSDIVMEDTEADSGSESSETILMDSSLSNSEDDDNEKTTAENTHQPVTRQSDTVSSKRKVNSRRINQSIKGVAKNLHEKVPSKRSRRRTNSTTYEHHNMLPCIDCGLKFPSKQDLWRHRTEVKHPLPTVNIPTKFNLDIYSLEEYKEMGFIKCEGCDLYFLGKRRQMKHFYVVHRDLMPTPTCPICCKEFKSYAELLKHKREEGHRDSLSSLNNYQCDLCGKHMTSYSNFVQHKQFVCGIGEKEMEKIRIHACDLCGKLFKSPRHVRRHKKISHFKVPEVCDVCGTVCQGRKALDVHKKRHDERNKKHKCGDCGKAFFSDSKLQEHIRTHTKEKPFKCPLCSYTCAVKPNVHKHATNVHKQTVVPIDLRKTAASIENKLVSNISANTDPNLNLNIPEMTQTITDSKTTETTSADKYVTHAVENIPLNMESKVVPVTFEGSGMNTTAQANSQVSVANNHIPSAYIDFELNRNIHEQTESNIQLESIPVSYGTSGLNSNIQAKQHATLVSDCGSPTYGSTEFSMNIQEKTQAVLENGTTQHMYTDSDVNRSVQELCQTTQTPYNMPMHAGSDYSPYPYQCQSQPFHIEKN